jgi:hypothetical protein
VEELDDPEVLARIDRLRLQARAADFSHARLGMAGAEKFLHAAPWLRQGCGGVIAPPDMAPLVQAAVRLLDLAWVINPDDLDDPLVDLHGAVDFDNHPAYSFAYLSTLAARSISLTPEAPALDNGWLGSLLPTTAYAHNPAKQLAVRFLTRVPLLWGAEPWLVAIAQDWQLRILRYAESAALVAGQEEMLHGWSMARFPAFWPNALCIARLSDPEAPDDARTAALQSIFQKRRFDAIEIAAPGAERIDQAVHLLHLGEWVALYLAALHGIDPADRAPLQLLGLVT